MAVLSIAEGGMVWVCMVHSMRCQELQVQGLDFEGYQGTSDDHCWPGVETMVS